MLLASISTAKVSLTIPTRDELLIREMSLIPPVTLKSLIAAGTFPGSCARIWSLSWCGKAGGAVSFMSMTSSCTAKVTITVATGYGFLVGDVVIKLLLMLEELVAAGTCPWSWVNLNIA